MDKNIENPIKGILRAIKEDTTLPPPRSQKMRDLAARGVIAGKKLQEWADAPAGAFQQVVREMLDPYFGLQMGDEPQPIMWEVRVRYTYMPPQARDYASKKYHVEAVTAEEAIEKAEESFNDDSKLETGEDHEFDSCDDPIPTP